VVGALHTLVVEERLPDHIPLVMLVQHMVRAVAVEDQTTVQIIQVVLEKQA
jgi:hypothetical protein